MQKYSFMKIIAIFISGIVILLMLGYINIKLPRAARVVARKRYCQIETYDERQVVDKVRDATIRELKKDYTYDHEIYYSKSFTRYCRGNKISVYEYGEYGLLLYYSFLVAKKTHDEEMLELVKHRFDIGLSEHLNSIVRCDQVSYGLVAIELYLYYQDEKYRYFVDAIYNHCNNSADANGLILYRSYSNEQQVDALGFVPMFLCRYGEVFSNNDAIVLAENLVYDYMKNGVDRNTGFPCQTYRISDKLKINRANWSRGCAWYMLGVSSLPNLSTQGKIIYNKLVELLKQNGLYEIEQYYGQDGSPDMSAVVPIVHTLVQRGDFTPSVKEIIENVGPYIRYDGRLSFMSPTIGMPYERPEPYTGGSFFNAMLLDLLTRVE